METLAAAQGIKLLILDVDGILTPGVLNYAEDGNDLKTFHIHDGLGLKLLQRFGIKVAIISGKTSQALKRRLEELGIKHIYLGHENKRAAYQELKQILTLNDHEIAYMGDDLPDLPLLLQVGWSISVPNAHPEVLQRVNFITKNFGGSGAVREVCDIILKAQSNYDSMLQSYLVI